MKKIVLTMIAALTMTAAMAQDNENQQRREFKKPTPEQMTDRMAQQLSLTDEQKEKVLTLNKEYENVIGFRGMGRRGPGMGRPNRRSNDQNNATDGQQTQRPQRPQLTDEQKAEMQKNMEKRQEYDKKLKEILTDEQYQNYQKQHQRRGGRGGFGGRGTRTQQQQN